MIVVDPPPATVSTPEMHVKYAYPEYTPKNCPISGVPAAGGCGTAGQGGPDGNPFWASIVNN